MIYLAKNGVFDDRKKISYTPLSHKLKLEYELRENGTYMIIGLLTMVILLNLFIIHLLFKFI